MRQNWSYLAVNTLAKLTKLPFGVLFPNWKECFWWNQWIIACERLNSNLNKLYKKNRIFPPPPLLSLLLEIRTGWSDMNNVSWNRTLRGVGYILCIASETRAVCQRRGSGSYRCRKCLAALNWETYRDLELCTVTPLSEVPVSKPVILGNIYIFSMYIKMLFILQACSKSVLVHF